MNVPNVSKLTYWMVGASVASALAATMLAGFEFEREIIFGMAGPLGVVTGSWLLMEWTHRRNPGGLTTVMMAGFAAKMVVFGAYVVVMLKGLALRPAPFAASFTSYFIALYCVEALGLRRLMADGGRAVR